VVYGVFFLFHQSYRAYAKSMKQSRYVGFFDLLFWFGGGSGWVVFGSSVLGCTWVLVWD